MSRPHRNHILRATFAAMGVIALISGAQAAPLLPDFLEEIPAPGNAVQMEFSADHGLLFLRNSGSAVRVVDTNLGSQIEVFLATENFTDMDLTADGNYLFVADHGPVSIGYGNVVRPHYVHRYDLQARTWQTALSHTDAWKVEAVDANRMLLLSSDQHVNVSLHQFGSTLQELARTSSNYSGDIEFDPQTGRIYHGNSGLSSQEITVRRLVGNMLIGSPGTESYGSASGHGGSSVLSTDGEQFYYGGLQVEALDVTHNRNVFPEIIRAATGQLAFGKSIVYDAQTKANLLTLPFSTGVYALTDDGRHLWTYGSEKLSHYTIGVPEPGTIVLAAMGFAMACPRRRASSIRPGKAIGPPPD